MDRRPISVTVPSEARHVRILRTIGCSAASAAGFGLDRIEDLALAIDEASAALLRSAPGPHLQGTLVVDEGRVGVTIGTEGDGEGAWPPDGWDGTLGARVLAALADDVTFATPPKWRTVQFTVG